MSSAPRTRLAVNPQVDQTVDRDREELYRRLAKINKHLDASQSDRGTGETAPLGLVAITNLLPYAALVRFNCRIDHANGPVGALLAAWSKYDLLSLPWRDLLHPVDWPLSGIPPTECVAEQNQPVNRFVRRDGTSFEVSIRKIQIPWRG